MSAFIHSPLMKLYLVTRQMNGPGLLRGCILHVLYMHAYTYISHIVAKLGFHVRPFPYLCHGARGYAIGLPAPVRVSTHYIISERVTRDGGWMNSVLGDGNTLVSDHFSYPGFYLNF